MQFLSQCLTGRFGLLGSAAGLFAMSSLPLLPDYVQLAASLFSAQVQTLPSEPAAAVNIINAWCSAQTHGKIAEIAREEDIQPGVY